MYRVLFVVAAFVVCVKCKIQRFNFWKSGIFCEESSIRFSNVRHQKEIFYESLTKNNIQIIGIFQLVLWLFTKKEASTGPNKKFFVT